MKILSEEAIEQLALDELQALGWQIAFGPDIAFDGPHPERNAAANYGDVVLVQRLREALVRINPEMPDAAIEEALRQMLTLDSPALIENNRRFHQLLTDGVDVSWTGAEGERHALAPLPPAGTVSCPSAPSTAPTSTASRATKSRPKAKCSRGL